MRINTILSGWTSEDGVTELLGVVVDAPLATEAGTGVELGVAWGNVLGWALVRDFWLSACCGRIAEGSSRRY